MLRAFKKKITFLKKWPIHPQWLCSLRSKATYSLIKKTISQGVIVDIGCADKWPKTLIPAHCQYIGLDFPQTALIWYYTTPDIFGDAQELPILSSRVDTVLLLDVLEHLQDPAKALSEAYRVMKKDGKLILQVPFLYPIHDAPRDFHRWTIFGLRDLAQRHGFTVFHEVGMWHPLESAAVIKNLAMANTLTSWIQTKHPLSLLILFFPFYVLLNNIASLIFARLSHDEAIMPLSYLLILGKKPTTNRN